MTMISSTGDFSVASLARSRNGETVTSTFAPESRSWKAISSGVYSELIGDMTQPAAAMPWKTTGYHMVFGLRTATTSPLRSPRAARAAARRST
jgi:hypothetical protein